MVPQCVDSLVTCSAGPPHASVLAAVQCSVAAVLLLALSWLLQRGRRAEHAGSLHVTRVGGDPAADEESLEPLASTTTRGGAGDVAGNAHGMQGGPVLRVIRHALSMETDSSWAAGLEVGVWAFAANTCTVVGFENTAASRGAFLIRLSAILTPMVASLAGVQLPGRWAHREMLLRGCPGSYGWRFQWVERLCCSPISLDPVRLAKN